MSKYVSPAGWHFHQTFQLLIRRIASFPGPAMWNQWAPYIIESLSNLQPSSACSASFPQLSPSHRFDNIERLPSIRFSGKDLSIMSSNKLDIVSFPPEVFEMIVGAISFVDLPHFLQTSKTINVHSIRAF